MGLRGAAATPALEVPMRFFPTTNPRAARNALASLLLVLATASSAVAATATVILDDPFDGDTGLWIADEWALVNGQAVTGSASILTSLLSAQSYPQTRFTIEARLTIG